MFPRPKKYTLSSLTFAFLLSANLFISAPSFAGAQEDYQEGVMLFSEATPKDKAINFDQLREAIIRFSQAQNTFGSNTRDQGYALLFKARTAEKLKQNAEYKKILEVFRATNIVSLFESAVNLFKAAEKDEDVKYGLADALYYQAEEMLSRSTGQDDLRKIAKATFDEAFNLVQNPEQKVRVGKKLADMCIEDRQARANAERRESLRDEARAYRLGYLDFITNEGDKAIAHTEIAKLFSEVKARETTNLEMVVKHAVAARELIKTLRTDASEKQKADLNELLQRAEFTMGRYDHNRIIKYATQYMEYCEGLLNGDKDLDIKKQYARSYAFSAINLANAYLSKGDLENAQKIHDRISDQLEKIAGFFRQDVSQSVVISDPSLISNPDLKIRVELTLSKIRLQILNGTPKASDNDILALTEQEKQLSQSDYNKLRAKSLKIKSELALAKHPEFKKSETVDTLIGDWKTFWKDRLNNIPEDRKWKYADDFFECYHNLAKLKAYNAKVYELSQSPDDLKENSALDGFKSQRLANWKEVEEFQKKAIEIAGKSGFYDKERLAQIELSQALNEEIRSYTSDGLAPTNVALDTLRSNLSELTTYRSFGITRTKTEFSESEKASKAELEKQISDLEKQIKEVTLAKEKADSRTERLQYACAFLKAGNYSLTQSVWGAPFNPFGDDTFELTPISASNESSSSSSESSGSNDTSASSSTSATASDGASIEEQ